MASYGTAEDDAVPRQRDGPAWASWIWPVAAAAWLSSSLSVPAGSLNCVRPRQIAPEETSTISQPPL